MKNKINNMIRMGTLLALTIIAALGMGQVSVSANPPQDGRSGGGLPYPTASTWESNACVPESTEHPHDR